MKNKKVAVFLSLLFPGLGHLYIGQYLDAVVFIAGAGVLWYALYVKGFFWFRLGNPRFYLLIVGLLVVYLYSLIDAYRRTK